MEQAVKNMNGIIKTLSQRGFGFISLGEESKDLFFHKKDLKNVEFDDLKLGQAVKFEKVINGEKGPAATNVFRMES